MDIKAIMKNNTVRFSYYRQGIAYYLVKNGADGENYIFPAPLEDIADASLQAEDKAILFMRYIRKAIEDGMFEKARQS